MRLPFPAVNLEALRRSEVLLPLWLPGGRWQGVEWVALNPKRADTKVGSLSVNSKTGIWKDFAADDGGADLISLFAWVQGLGQGESCQVLAAEFGISLEEDGTWQTQVVPLVSYPRPILPVPETAPPLTARFGEEARWEYLDEEGRLLLVRVRTTDPTKGKKVITWTWCETGPGTFGWQPKAPHKPWPLYGLDRLARNPTATVIVVEGEKTADAAERIFPGLVAVTSGSADSAGSAKFEDLAGRDVILWHDADGPGLKYRDKAAELLLGIARTLRLVALPEAITAWTKSGSNKPGGWDLADPAPPGVDLQGILDAARSVEQDAGPTADPAPGEPQEWPAPLPLTSRVDPEPYPVAALPPLIRAAVEEVHGFVKAPVPLLASSALATLSLAIQPHYDMKRADRLAGPCSLFFLTVAKSGERKSSCDDHFTKAIKTYEAKQAEAAKPVLRDHQVALGIWESKRSGIRDAIRKLAKEGKPTQAQESQLMALEHDEPNPPRVPRLTYADYTTEELKWNLATAWPSGAVISNEAGIVFGSHGMGSDVVMRNLGTLNMLWDGADIPTDRRTSESFRLSGARLTVALQIQESALRAFLDQAKGLARGMGFLARFLVAMPESTIGYRPFSEAGKWPNYEAFNQRIAAILTRSVAINESGGLTPAMLTFSAEAMAEWVAFYNRIEFQLRAGGRLHDISDVASKAADNVARLAALFHAFEGVGAGGVVAVGSLRSASAIVEWHLNESLRFFGELALPRGLVVAGRLDSWLIERCKREGSNQIPTKEVQQYGPNGLREKAVIDAAMQELEELGRAHRICEGRRRFLAVNPALLRPTGAATATVAISATQGERDQPEGVVGSSNGSNSSGSSSEVLGDHYSPLVAASGDSFAVDL